MIMFKKLLRIQNLKDYFYYIEGLFFCKHPDFDSRIGFSNKKEGLWEVIFGSLHLRGRKGGSPPQKKT